MKEVNLFRREKMSKTKPRKCGRSIKQDPEAMGSVIERRKDYIVIKQAGTGLKRRSDPLSQVYGRWRISNYIYYSNIRVNGTLDGNMFYKKKWKKLKAKEVGQRCPEKEDA